MHYVFLNIMIYFYLCIHFKIEVSVKLKSFFLSYEQYLSTSPHQLASYHVFSLNKLPHSHLSVIKPYDSLEIEQLIAACKEGKAMAHRAFIKKYIAFVKSICYRYKPNDYQIDEILNDCFLKIFNNIHSYDLSKPILAWIRIIAINTCIDYYRKNQKIESTKSLEDIEYEDSSGNVLNDLAGEQILELIAKLPNSYRLVFTLYVIDGYSHREIADLLGIKEGTSKSNLQDARIKLQEMVKYEYPVLYKLYSLKNRVNEN